MLRPLVPPEFDIEALDGSAWLGIVPFEIRGSRFPAIPWTIDFPETNVRTYVRSPSGETGVWFFSLDAGKLLPVLGARASFGLPYMWSRMQVSVEANRIRYMGDRIWPGPQAGSDIVVEVGEPNHSVGALEVFLIGRYRLFSRLLGRIVTAEVEHVPYPLAKVKLIECRQTLFPVAGTPDEIHYSPGVEVRIGGPEFLRTTRRESRAQRAIPDSA